MAVCFVQSLQLLILSLLQLIRTEGVPRTLAYIYLSLHFKTLVKAPVFG